MIDFDPEIMYYEGELDFPRKKPCWFLHDDQHIRTRVEPAPPGELGKIVFVYRCRKCGTIRER